MYIPIIQVRGISSAELEPIVFEQSAIPAMWPELEALLLPCIEEANGMLSSASLLQWLLEGWATAFATIKENKVVAVLIIMPVDYATYRCARVVACGGSDLRGATKFIDALEAWALTQGCVELEAWCRPVVARLIHGFGWNQKLIILNRDLRRKLQ